MTPEINLTPPRDNLVRALADLGVRTASGAGEDAMPILFGHFAEFNRWVPISSLFEGRFMERFAHGAFTKTISEGRTKMRVVFEHGKDPQFGLKPLGPLLTLKDDTYYEVQLLDTSYCRDLIPGLAAGLYGSSFRFTVIKQDVVKYPGRSDYNPDGLPERTVIEARVPEFGPCTFPAYGGANAGLMRSITDEVLMSAMLNDPERLAHVPGSQILVPAGLGSPADVTIFKSADNGDQLLLEVDVVAAIPVHHTPVVDSPWNGPAQEANMPNDGGEAMFRKMYAWVDPDKDANTKAAYKLAHHMCQPGGSPGAANINGVRNALSRIPQMRPPLSATDEAAVKAHLNAHMADYEKQNASASFIDLNEWTPDTAVNYGIKPGDMADFVEEEFRSGRMYERSLGYVSETCWVVLPETLRMIQLIFSERAAGVRLTDEQIRERLGVDVLPSDEEPVEPVVDESSPVRVIEMHGTLIPRGNVVGNVSGPGATSVENLQKEFRAAVADEAVKAIVLDINSPGGDARMIPEFGAEIQAARAQKPVYAIANTMAASGAYWLGSQATELSMIPSGHVGSIGVYTAHEDWSSFDEQKGVKTTLVFAGDHKVERNPFEPLSEEAKADMQENVNMIYDKFVGAVAEGRGVSTETVLEKFGQGRVFQADPALEAGMVDYVETFDQLMARIEESLTPMRSQDFSVQLQPNENVFALREALVEEAALGTSASREHEAAKPNANTNELERSDEVLTIEELRARQDEIRARAQEIFTEYGADQLPEELQAEWDNMADEQVRNDERIKDFEQRAATLARIAGDGRRTEGTTQTRVALAAKGSRIPENVFAVENYRSLSENTEQLVQAFRDGAMRVVEQASFPSEGIDKEAVQGHIQFLLDNNDKSGDLAQRILITGSPVYARAFGKSLAGTPLTNEETRALSLADAAGGYAVPFTLDPTVIGTSDGEVNPLRQLARVETITNDEWKGVTSAGITVTRKAEAEETDDNSFTLDQPTCKPTAVKAFVPFSIEVGQDWTGVQTEIARMLQEAKDQEEADVFTNGLGPSTAGDEPAGIISTLDASSTVLSLTTNAFGVEDVYATKSDLPPRWRSRAVWLANDSIYSAIRQIDTAGGSSLWAQLQEARPGLLLGKAAYESSEMDDSAVSGAKILLYGDFNQFLIVDRVGMTIEVIPHLMGSNHRPTGQRGIFAMWRNSSTILVHNAFRVLEVGSTS